MISLASSTLPFQDYRNSIKVSNPVAFNFINSSEREKVVLYKQKNSPEKEFKDKLTQREQLLLMFFNDKWGERGETIFKFNSIYAIERELKKKNIEIQRKDIFKILLDLRKNYLFITYDEKKSLKSFYYSFIRGININEGGVIVELEEKVFNKAFLGSNFILIDPESYSKLKKEHQRNLYLWQKGNFINKPVGKSYIKLETAYKKIISDKDRRKIGGKKVIEELKRNIVKNYTNAGGEEDLKHKKDSINIPSITNYRKRKKGRKKGRKKV